MTKKDLERIKAYCEAATPGPWYQDCTPSGPCGARCYKEIVGAQSSYPNPVVAQRPDKRLDVCGSPKQTFADMCFIAKSRADLPACVAEIERLREAARKMAEAVTYYLNAYELGCEVSRVKDCGVCVICCIRKHLAAWEATQKGT